ncbi:MAG: PD-(D/E)XK nuclease family protein [Anaerotardibacter sp.]
MKHRTVWFQTYAQALTYTKNLSATSTNALLGISATTPVLWLEDMWGLWGTGQILVSSNQRILLVNHLLKQFPTLASSNNTALLIAQFFGDIIGVPAFDQARTCLPSNLSKAEQDVLRLSEAYEQKLSQLNLIEPGRALFALPEFVFTKEYSFGSFCVLPLYFQEALTLHNISVSMPTACIEKLPASVEPTFIFSSGKTVQSRLLFEEIRSFIEREKEDSVLIVHPNPSSLYETLAPALIEKNISHALLSSKAFSDTSFGKGFLALYYFFTEEYAGSAWLTDFLLSCLSGASKQRASQLDAIWRSNRLIEKEEQLAQALQESPTLDYLLELFEDADASIVLGFIEDFLKENLKTKPAFMKEQLSALEALRSLYQGARQLNLTPDEFLPLLENLPLAYQFSSTEKTPSLVIANLNRASTFEKESFGEVIVSCLDSETYQAAEEHNATTTLLEKIGAFTPTSHLSIMRHQFGHLQTCAQKRFVCERLVLNQGTECYPAFMWDEFVNLYRENENDKAAFDLPKALCTAYVSEGEEQISLNAALLPFETHDISHDEIANSLKPLEKKLVHTRLVNGVTYPVLSPSALESYANCPYRWFYERKTGTQEMDEGFSALEKGIFAHSVFETFFNTLREEHDTLSLFEVDRAYAHDLLETCFNQAIEEQYALEPLSGRLVATNAIEQEQLQNLKSRLEICLDNQYALPEEYVPQYFEFEINGYEKREGAENQNASEAKQNNQTAASTHNEPVLYAGTVLNGRIDRVDFSKDGKYFAVIDYKGSVNGHRAGFDDEKDLDVTLPHKMQGLIYASAISKLFPEKIPAAALYLSYNAKAQKEFLAGSYSPIAYNAAGHIHKSNAVTVNFQSYLDKIETLLTPYVERLVAGDITPKPLCKESCNFCPVANCSARWNGTNHD